MTPDKARALLDGTTPGPWDVGGAPDEPPAVVKHRTVDGGPLIACDTIAQEIHTDVDAALIAAAPGMAAMIAGMRPEYAVQVRRSGRWQYSRDEDDFRWQDLAVQMVRADRDHPGEETRIVRRYVTTPEDDPDDFDF